MKKLQFQILIFFTLCINSFGQYGLFVGIKPINYSELRGSERLPDDFHQRKAKRKKFYKISYLKIIGDSAYLDESSFLLHHHDTIFTKNDGICFYYRGLLNRKGSSLHFDLQEVVVNYFEAVMISDSTGFHILPRCFRKFEGQLNKKGIQVDDILFEKKSHEKILMSQKPELFKKLQNRSSHFK